MSLANFKLKRIASASHSFLAAAQLPCIILLYCFVCRYQLGQCIILRCIC